ncbi:LysR family transcriptional regulator [Paenibacillus solisilvae]|uniref:LysR family transcriptional regulator n=1 Tax=Paenibacillus solisilvae TaxID=2486751 RepID=A0ABW0W0E3_9BACL
MDLKTLKTFQLIVAHGSFNRAAEALNYAQSTVTMQIQRLESDLGVQLLERDKKKVQLTEAGRLFHEQSLQIVNDLEHLQTRLSDHQLGEAGHIRLGATEPSASHRLPAIIASFLAQFPRIHISVDIASTAVLSERLLQGVLDLALSSAPDLGASIFFEPLYKEDFVLIMSEEHPLAQQPVIELKDIQEHRLLITAADCPYRRKLEFILQESGRTTLDTMVISSMTALRYYAAAGMGIALVPRISLNPIPAGTLMRPLPQQYDLGMVCGIQYKASEHPLKLASAKLVQFLKEQLTDRALR